MSPCKPLDAESQHSPSMPCLSRSYGSESPDFAERIKVPPLEPNVCPSPPTSHLTRQLIGEVEEMPTHGDQAEHYRLVAAEIAKEREDLTRDLLRAREATPTFDEAEGNFKKEWESEEDEQDNGQSMRAPTPRPRRSTTLTSTPPPYTSRDLHSGRAYPSGSHQSRKRRDRSPTPRTALPTVDDAVHGQDDVDESQEVPPRELRKRNIRQVNPYKYDKHQHQLATTTGKAVNTEVVEEAVQDEIDSVQRSTARKKARTSSASTRGRGKANRSAAKQRDKGRRSSSIVSSAAPEADAHDPASVTLRVWLDGFPGGSAPTTLEDCDSLDKLIDFILKSWGWNFAGGTLSYAIVSFPWLDDTGNILVRKGLEDSFRQMVSEIESAPIWADKGNQERCEVNVTVFLRQAKA